jgi:hypothetical protein
MTNDYDFIETRELTKDDIRRIWMDIILKDREMIMKRENKGEKNEE